MMTIQKYLNRIEMNLKFLRDCSKFMKYTDLICCAYGRLIKADKPLSIHLNGYHFNVRPYTSDLVVAYASFCNKEFAGIYCESPRWIIDAGANIGASSVFFAAKYPDATIIAIEPEESNYLLLEMNVRQYPNVIPVKAALWKTQERISILETLSGKWGYTVVKESLEDVRSTKQMVKCVTVKSLMDEYAIDNIDLLKMDIEGSEKAVLENSSEWINSVSILTVELHDRICVGCEKAFQLATRNYKRFARDGEKFTAYRI